MDKNRIDAEIKSCVDELIAYKSSTVSGVVARLLELRLEKHRVANDSASLDEVQFNQGAIKEILWILPKLR